MSDSSLEFQKIHDDFRPKILRYLTRMIGEHDAEDMTQEVFVKINRGLKGFRGESQLSTWIYRIATNAALDRLKGRSSQKGLSEELNGEVEEDVEECDVWTGEKKPSIERSLMRKEMNDCIRNIVDALPVNYRTVIVPGEVEGFTNNELAEVLGISLDTVKIRLHRARARLKKELERHCSLYRDERNELACDRKTPTLKFIKK